MRPSVISSSMAPVQLPQSVPAPQARPTSETVRAPRSTTSWIFDSGTPLQMQTIMCRY